VDEKPTTNEQTSQEGIVPGAEQSARMAGLAAGLGMVLEQPPARGDRDALKAENERQRDLEADHA